MIDTIYYVLSSSFSIKEAKFVDEILNDPRSWGKLFKRVLQPSGSKPFIFVTIMFQNDINLKFKDYPHLKGLSVCDSRNKNLIKIYINFENWNSVPKQSGYKHLLGYRTYLILHEFGHALGKEHEDCPGKGMLAPTMMQQTLGSKMCHPDPWPVKDFQ